MTTRYQPTVSVIESITSVDRILKNTKLLMVDSDKTQIRHSSRWGVTQWLTKGYSKSTKVLKSG